MQTTLDDMSQPVTESYLHLSQDATTTDLSSTSFSSNNVDTTRLLRLAKDMDKLLRLSDDSNQKRFKAKPSQMYFSSHSTPLAPKNQILYPEEKEFEEASNKQKYTLNDICESVRPLLSSELNEVKEIKTLLESLLKQNNKFNETDYDISYLPKRFKNEYNSNENEKIELLHKEIEFLKKETDELKRENLNLKIHVNDLEIKANDSKGRLHETINPNITRFMDSNENGQLPSELINSLKALNNILTSKLERSKANNRELINEVDWLKEQLKSPLAFNKEKSDFSDPHKEELEAEVLLLRKEIGKKLQLIDEETVSREFQGYYSKLQLYKIDRLSKVEMSNLIKNMMLSLLMSDYDNLPYNAVKYGKFLKLSMNFLDTLHSVIYKDQNVIITPSSYLRNPELDDENLNNLLTCLQGLLSTCTALNNS
ncbi:uncharacterized protein PRCAT00003130001 [Priceomyces carsonii]|uniref:uncharacterized protein n=1 Tax=Priceomyces carsonii TaxID=28549 RepID=UPI002ED95E79|nr:unnamed protein product [Priceomyces carsonii]